MIFLTPIIYLLTICVYFFKELFTPQEIKTWWSKVKRRHIVQSVHPDREDFDRL